ncbi:MAG: hypothetical protein JWO72_1891 [Caulobacteraceae bacterium]|nr:hypothetical protein [Caulobacteraceae bacterium]
MTTQYRMRSLALGAVALVMAAAPAAVATAQPYYDRDAQYEAQQRDYQARQAQYENDRREYDRRYGRGAYDRYYASHSGGYERTDREACHDEKKGNQVGGAILGGIAGAVIGSNVARGGGREGGAIIGGVGGAALGSNIAKNATHCDER